MDNTWDMKEFMNALRSNMPWPEPPKGTDMQELKEIALELMHALHANNLGEVKIKLGGASIQIRANAAPIIQTTAEVSTPAAAEAPAPDQSALAAAPAAEKESGTPVKSPLVGTFYSSPAPDAPPFVLVGQRVRKGDTLFIVEAMKTMNEIKAPCDGTVVRILAQPGDMVEYNQTVVVLEET